jgi:hypothetical protein
MKLESHEFWIISLCWKNVFTYKRHICICGIMFCHTLKNLYVFFIIFKNALKNVLGFNIIHKKCHMCWTIKKSFWILCGDFIVDSNVQTSLMINIIQILWSWLKVPNCKCDCNIKLDAKFSYVYHDMNHMWSQYWYLVF